MIFVFGYVKCDFKDCEAQYDSQIELIGDANGHTTLRPVNRPTGWFVSKGLDPSIRCPKHSGARPTSGQRK